MSINQELTGHTGEANIEILRADVARDPASGLAHRRLADQLRKTGDLKGARLRFLAAVENLSTDADACYGVRIRLALVDMKLERYIEAVDTLLAVLQLRPGDRIASVNLGVCYLRQREYDLALAAFHCILNESHDAAVYTNRGITYFKMRNWAAARSDLEKAIEMGSASAGVHFLLGKCLKSLDEHEAAAAQFRRVIEIDDRHSAAYANLAELLSDGGQLTLALKAAESAAELAPSLAHAHLIKGDVYRKTGSYDEATSEYEMVIELDSSSPFLFRKLASLRLDQVAGLKPVKEPVILHWVRALTRRLVGLKQNSGMGGS